MRKFIKKNKINFVNAIIGAVLFSVLPVVVEFYVIKSTPASLYFQYFEIIPAKPVYDLGEKPRIFSDAEIKKALPMQWKDVLKCNGSEHPDTFAFFSSYPSETGEATIKKRTPIDDDTGGWIYQGTVPTTENRTCYIDSTITALLPYGLKKVQRIESATFEFQESSS